MGFDVKTREERAFRPISGHRALDLLATLRDRQNEAIECLRQPADLDRWLAVAGLATGAHATRTDLERACELRETINRAVRSALEGAAPRATDARELNAWARQPALTPQLGPAFELRWTGGVAAALVVVAREAVELLSSADRALIRECSAAPACSRVYLDRSRSRRRRWCSMDWCGSSSKMKSYRSRLTATSSS